MIMVPKFRAWYKEKKMMCEVKGISYPFRMLSLFSKGVYVEVLSASFDDVIIMQSTGLFDKNGVEIFEGDVVFNGWRNIVVTFGEQTKEENFGDIRQYVGFNLTTACGYPEPFKNDYTVVGNIHKNPELVAVNNVTVNVIKAISERLR